MPRPRAVPQVTGVKYDVTYKDNATADEPTALRLSRTDVPKVLNKTWAGRILNLEGFIETTIITKSGVLTVKAVEVSEEEARELPRLGIFS